MNDPTPKARRRWRVTVWGLMLLPLACAPLFYWLSMADRMTPARRAEEEYHWATNPFREFWPKEGAWVRPGEEVRFKLAKVIGPLSNGEYYGLTWWLTPDGKIHNQWHFESDAGGGEAPAPAELLAQLPTLLKKLPPSDPAAGLTNRVVVVLPIDGCWEVRSYRREALPKVVEDLVNTLKLSGF